MMELHQVSQAGRLRTAQRISVGIICLMAAAAHSAAAAGLSSDWTQTWTWDTAQKKLVVLMQSISHPPENTPVSTIGDLDGDGREERVESIWRPGRFGKVRPRWIRSDTKSLLPHIDVSQNGRNMWQSSAIERAVCSLRLVDLDHDNRDELVVLEARPAQMQPCRPNTLAVWEWTDWGFQLMWRSEAGSFGTLRVSRSVITTTLR